MDRSARRGVWLLAVPVVLLIAYGSLYPFRFSSSRTALFQWQAAGGLSAIRDTAINLGLYFPAGFLLFHAPSKARKPLFRIAFAVGFSFALSGVLEFLQAYDRGRFSSSMDLALNCVGAAIGAVSASLLGFRIPGAGFIRRNPAAFFLLVLAVSAHLFPFFPRVHEPQYRAVAARFFDPRTLDLSKAPFFLLEWIAMRVLLSSLLGRAASSLEFTALALLIPAGFFIVDQWPAPAEVLGCALALAVSHWRLPHPRQFAQLLLLDVIGRELMPFRPAAVTQPFQWVPFSGVLEAVPLSVIVLLQKFFLYGTVLWLFQLQGKRRMLWTTGFAALLFGLEQIQQFLPGRTPEVTDAVMALLVGAVLVVLQASLPAKQL